MTTNAPIEHREEALKLEADAFVDLWQVTLKGNATVFYFCNGVSRTWQGQTYEALACQLKGEGANTDDQSNRPQLTVVNPEKIFGPFAAAGYFDLAEITRKRVLQQHYLNNVNIFQQRVWIVGRPSLVTSQLLQLELRSSLDMPIFKTPARTFSPPEFPFIVI